MKNWVFGAANAKNPGSTVQYTPEVVERWKIHVSKTRKIPFGFSLGGGFNPSQKY